MSKKEMEELEEDYEQFDEEIKDDDIEDTEEEQEEKDTKKKIKKLDTFQQTIKEYLDNYSNTDEAFKTRYDGSNEKIVECCNYIINCVKESKRQGFADEEIYKLARDYYVDDIDKDKCKDSGRGTVVVNHTIELTEQEKEKARIEAIKRLEEEILKEERKKREDEAKAQAKEEEKARKQEEARIKKEEERIRKEEEKKKALEEQKAKELEEAKANGGGEQMSLFDILGD